MKSFLKTYLIVLGVISGIAAFIALMFWGLSQLFGEYGPTIGFAIIVISILSFAITSAIENG
jgi:hypothetical protein